MTYLGIGFGLALIFMSWKVTQLWRNANLVAYFMDTFAFLPFGHDVRRGEVRSLGVRVIFLWGILAMFFLGLYDVTMDGVLLALSGVLVIVVMLCLMLEVCVVLFNRPKFIVPPHMRSDLGVIAARRARRRKVRRRSVRE
ncbi:hypothetical protein [Streptomyces blattellae]|uniref:hypothetical protein n=1 Tax=Streptomyces blattellae TaxID=2569855 RepID=UPI0012B93A48|nr:hypothetical protein [Streptomyces blattellae]